MGEKIFKLKAMIMLKSAKMDEHMFPEKKIRKQFLVLFSGMEKMRKGHPTLLAL